MWNSINKKAETKPGTILKYETYQYKSTNNVSIFVLKENNISLKTYLVQNTKYVFF